MKGKVKFYNRTKGYGFIAGEDGTDYFVHRSGLKEGVFLRDNDDVTFDAAESTDRGPKAVNVNKVGGGSSSGSSRPSFNRDSRPPARKQEPADDDMADSDDSYDDDAADDSDDDFADDEE